ncbi:hypothetical protein ACVRW4_00465 [Streptococcus phocae subsp. phocae]|uniref:Uncharacterized protein n=1 Tax=Streptococcus phocae TaxID=119224 RepID=A0A0P6SR57_9STRE|nr:hypothetical protein [Streptococcus phocae]KPJ22160.1 hypothetical protein AKK44_06105 [Streptococcus phocae]
MKKIIGILYVLIVFTALLACFILGFAVTLYMNNEATKALIYGIVSMFWVAGGLINYRILKKIKDLDNDH